MSYILVPLFSLCKPQCLSQSIVRGERLNKSDFYRKHRPSLIRLTLVKKLILVNFRPAGSSIDDEE